MSYVASIATIYAVASALAFALFGLDKSRARTGGPRIPEATLHLVELLGGWPGAYLGMNVYRHKTQKLSYQVVYWAVVLIHLGGWLLLWPKLQN